MPTWPCCVCSAASASLQTVLEGTQIGFHGQPSAKMLPDQAGNEDHLEELPSANDVPLVVANQLLELLSLG
jgi:hypothetical protein